MEYILFMSRSVWPYEPTI